MNVLVTGGAGYIGSHTVIRLIRKGHKVIIFDNLSKGHKEYVDKKAIFVKGDLAKLNEINNCIKKNKIDVVMHFAGFIEAGESMIKPEKYFTNNVTNGINLLNAMVKNRIKRVIYSSSAAVYGNPKKIPIEEEDETSPTNPYGESKLIFERILRWYDLAYGLKYTSLRYFNAAGADLSEQIGEKHNPETHLIPLALKSVLNNSEIYIFGTDYPTKDGTCIRDYIHVLDLADAHILALNNLSNESKVYNLGSERGYSVKQVIDAIKKITKKGLKIVETRRREGDPPVLIASSKKIKKELGWKAKYDLKPIIESAFKWEKFQK